MLSCLFSKFSMLPHTSGKYYLCWSKSHKIPAATMLGGKNLGYFTVEGFVYHRWPPIQFVDFVSWRFVSKYVKSDTWPHQHNFIQPPVLHQVNENFVIDQSFLNQTFDIHWHFCRQLLSKMPYLVLVPLLSVLVVSFCKPILPRYACGSAVQRMTTVFLCWECS